MKFIEHILKEIPELADHFDSMKNTQQDPEWHGEGNVLEHAYMVLNEVEKLGCYEEEKQLLRYAAVLHDIGKPKCSKVENGRIRSHGHSRIGYHIALELLDKTNLSFYEIKQIANLIKYHSDPIWVIEKEDPDREVIKMSMDCDIKLLYLLTTCDMLGRVAPDIVESIIKCDYFFDVAINLGCDSKPYIFDNEISKFNYLYRKTHHHTDVCFNSTKSKVYMMSGLPGTGKDTYISKNLSHLPIISLDEIRKELKIKPTDEQGLVIQTAKDRAKEFLRKGSDFVWNATNTSKKIREGLISLFDTYNAYITIIYLHNRLDKILEQNRQRELVVPEEVIRKLFRNIDIPMNNECHVVKYA